MEKRLLSRREVANGMHVSPETVDGYVKDGELAYVNVGRGKKRERRMFEESAVYDLIENRKRRGNGCISTKTGNRNIGRRKSGSRGHNIVDLRDARIAERRKRLLAGLKPSCAQS